MQLANWAVGQVNTLASGEINYEELEQRLRENSARPAIINVNIGTTVKGAVDDLDKVLSILERTGYSEDRFYIHCDGALFGLMVNPPSFTLLLPVPPLAISLALRLRQDGSSQSRARLLCL